MVITAIDCAEKESLNYGAILQYIKRVVYSYFETE